MAAATTPEIPCEPGLQDAVFTDPGSKVFDNPVLASPDQHVLNVIEAEDQNYIENVSKPPFADSALTDPFDEIVARKWVDEVVMNFPRGPPAECRRRPLADVSIKDCLVKYGVDGEFRVRVYDPVTAASIRPALIMYHGGGWIHGYPEVDEDIAIFFASELRAVVINVDYSLSPEHKFPVPHDDSYQAIQWTIDHAGEYKIDAGRIALWGCSAGGNLAAGVALRDAEEHKASRLCHVNLVVPATCHPDMYPPEMKSTEASVNKFDAVLGRQAIKLLLNKYAGDDSKHRHVSVLRADIPPNHPPVHVTVAGRDYLRDEGMAYSLRLRDAGVDSQLEIVPGVPHGLTFPPTTHVARQFFMNQARVLDYALNAA